MGKSKMANTGKTNGQSERERAPRDEDMIFNVKIIIFVAMMTKEELILDCRYYNGEEEAPDSTTSLYWDYERCWVEFVLNNDTIVQNCIDYYTLHYDLPNLLPEKEDGTPLGIKAILWSRCDHWCGPTEPQSFRPWYFEHYVADTKTHRQLLKQ